MKKFKVLKMDSTPNYRAFLTSTDFMKSIDICLIICTCEVEAKNKTLAIEKAKIIFKKRGF
jgi:hypothetical protein